MTIEKNNVSMASFFINQGYSYNQTIKLLERLYPDLTEFEIMATIKRAQDEIRERQTKSKRTDIYRRT